MFVNAGFYIFVRNTWIKIIVIVILASTKFQKKCSISENILDTEKKNDRKGLYYKYKKLIHKLKKKPIGNHTPRNTNSNWSPDIQM